MPFVARTVELMAQANAMPDPPLKNPYMEGIEAIEGILSRLRTFTKEYPKALAKEKEDGYIINLLRARDELHALRLDEMADEGRVG